MSSNQGPEQPQNTSRLDLMIQTFNDIKDDEEKCLRLLHELFEMMELMSQNGTGFDRNMEQISLQLLPNVLTKVGEIEPQFIDNRSHRIRRQVLEILSIMTFPDDKNKLPMVQLITFLITVIENDNEENADLAVKLIYELQKFYRTYCFILKEIPHGTERFIAAYMKILGNLSFRLEETKLTPEELASKRITQYDPPMPLQQQSSDSTRSRSGSGNKILIPAVHSMKTIVHFNSFYLWCNSIFMEVFSPHIYRLLSYIVTNVLGIFPQNHLPQVKNAMLYLDVLDALKNLLNFFNFLVKKSPRAQTAQAVDIFVEYFPQLISSEITILRNLPQLGTQAIRSEILQSIKQQLYDIGMYEKQDKAAVGANQQLRISRIDKGFYSNKSQTMKTLFEDFLVKPTLSGMGKQSKDLSHVSKHNQQSYIIMMYKDIFTNPQIKLAIQLTQRQILDQTNSLSLRNVMVINLYRLFEDLKKRKIDQYQDYSDQLENFGQQYKDLDYQMKIMSEEYKSMKGEISEMRKTSRIRLMNDLEQKNSEIRNILIADGGAYFVDLSKEKSIAGGEENINHFKHDYQYFFLHDYMPAQNLGDVTHQKENKYAFLSQFDDKQINDYMESHKENNCLRLVKNMLSFQDLVISQIIEKQGGLCYKYRDIKSLRKILIHGSNVVHYLCDMYIVNQPGQSLQFQTTQDRDKVFEIIKKFGRLFCNMLPLQFRDLIASVEESFLGRVIETQALQGDTGIFLLVENMMSFQPPQPQFMNQRPGQPPVQLPGQMPSFLNTQDEFPAHLNEIFFNFITKKMRIFNRPIGGETGDKFLSQNKLDKRLAKIPTADLQDTFQKLALIIGEKALSRKNDQRMKHLFFSVFIFCIKYTKTNKIIPYYYNVIKNIFKSLNNMNDNTNFVKEFSPMIQGLLETFLQAKEDSTYIKETNEICYSIPAKLKSLIEYIPSMSRPLIDSMKQNQVDIIENGITCIQMWVSALSSYPEILDPILDNMLPELNSFLQKMNCVLPNLTLKLLGKLSAKTRIYSEDKEIRAKNFPEEGLKVALEDKCTGREVVLPLDSAIGTILIKVFDQYHKYPEDKLIQAYKLVKNCFLCYVEPNYDVDFLVLSVINARTKNTELLTQYTMNSTKYFDSRRQQQKLSNMARGSEQHGFEKILKSILIASTIPKNQSETKNFREKIKKFFNWVTQYFTLIYISKNGKLNECLANEINPLIFIDDLCEFLYFNVIQNTPKAMQRSYIQGPIRAIKQMIRLVKEIYNGSQQEQESAILNLEFIQILIKKICHVAYSSELPNKVAMNLALQSLLHELPASFVKQNCSYIIDTVFHTVNINQENIIYQVEQECKKTLDMVFEKIGLYSTGHQGIEVQLKNFILDKVISQLYSTKAPARQLAIHFIERISFKTETISVKQLIENAIRPQRENPPIMGDNDRSWATYLISGYLDAKSKSLFQMHLGGYTQVLNLISYLEVLQFVIKHRIFEAGNRINLTIVICEQIIKILENEVTRYEGIVQPTASQTQEEQSMSSAMKSSLKYMKLEKYYMSQNKVYDPYSHTLHIEQFSNTSLYFEVEELAKKEKLASEIEAVQFGYSFYEMFIQRQVQQPQQPGQPPVNVGSYQIEINPKFTEKLSNQEIEQLMKNVNTRINDFIKKLFAQTIQASEISFDYIHHMYELYPNTRLHAELIAKCLTVLCDISVEDQIHSLFKLKTQAFFEQISAFQLAQNEYQQRLIRSYIPPASVGGSQPQAPLWQSLTADQQKQIDEMVQKMPFYNSQREPNLNVSSMMDYYTVEIKSKIIAMFFKFFQREEYVVFKAAKKCLSRLIKKESNQQDALPNPILKECVRPSLNIISMRLPAPALYEQLTRLIYVLHGCFNEQLGKHLIRCYDQSRPRFNEEFVLQMTVFKNQTSQPNQTPGEEGKPSQPPFSIESLSERERHDHFIHDVQRLVMQQNNRIEDIESTYHILKISYLLLQTYRHDIFKILLGVPVFETQIVSELEKKFKDTYRQLCEFYVVPFYNNLIPETFNLRPISIKIGHLKSDFREGLLKYCNKNPFDVCDLLKSQARRDFLQAPNDLPENGLIKLDLISEATRERQGGANFYDYILDIANDPQSFCLRERFARDTDLFKQFLNFEIISNEFFFGLKLIQILVKFNPNLLILNHFQQVMYLLRPRWVQMADVDLSFLAPQNITQYRKVYTKMMKIFVGYAQNPKSKMNAIVDLAKGYRNNGAIDMLPVKVFFQFDIPYRFSVERAKELVLNVVERLRIPPSQQFSSQSSNPNAMNPYENFYQLFDLVIVPLITRYSDTDQMFRSLIDEKFVYEFMDGIQNLVPMGTPDQPRYITKVELYKTNMELSQYYSSEQYLVEVIKVLNLIFRYFDLNLIVSACPKGDIQRLNSFLYGCAKKSKSPNLIEWSYYSLTSMFIRILNSLPAVMDSNIQNSERGAQYKSLMDMIDGTSDQVLMLILQHNNPMFFKAIVHKSFRNLIQIIEIVNTFKQVQHQSKMSADPSIQPITFPRQNEMVAHWLKEALIYEGRQQSSLVYLCSFILANSDSLYPYDFKFKFIQRINRIVSKMTASNTLNLSQKQMAIELCSVLINWARMRIIEFQRQLPGSSEILGTYYNLALGLFYNLVRISINVSGSSQELQKDNLDLIQHAIGQIKLLIHLFSGLQIQQIPLFDNMVQDNNSQQMGPAVMEHENIQLVRLIMLNIVYILSKYSQKKHDSVNFFLMKLMPVSLKFPKGILFSCRLLFDIIPKDLQEADLQRMLISVVRPQIERDVKRCLDKNFEDVLRWVKSIEDRYINEQRPPILSFQEQAHQIMQVIPHFAIRFIDYYERNFGKFQRQPLNLSLFDNDFTFYKNLMQVILKVITHFRKHLIFDQQDVSPTKLKFKHNVLHMTNNHSTQYSGPELITLNDDIVEIKVDDTNYDMFNKETIIMGLMLVAKKLKRLPNEEAIYILDNFVSAIQYLIKFEMNEYIIEGLRKIIDIIIVDNPEDVTRFTPERKYELVRYMVGKISELQAIDRGKESQKTHELIVKLYEQGVRVLEMQTSLMLDSGSKLFERLFILSKGKPVPLKYRVFEVFERHHGASLFKKFQFFFSKHAMEDSNEKADRYAFFSAQSQFLDFTLYGFRSQGDLCKTNHSSKFFSLYNLDVHFQNMVISEEEGKDDEKMREEGAVKSEYNRITKAIEGFTERSDKYKGKKIQQLMSYISDLISNNLSYSYDKLISDKLFLFLFHQYWSLLISREEQQILTEGINKHFLSCIQAANQAAQAPPQQPNQPPQPAQPIDPKKYPFTRMLLEAIAGVSPQIRVEPEVLQLLGKTFNLWHVVLPILENHMTVFPENERYFFATNELYEKLLESDYISGLRRQITRAPETRALVSYSQHDMWEEINQQFSHYLVYYSEQEGQYEQMDEDQRKPGKYQRQLAEQYVSQLQKFNEKYHLQKYQTLKAQNADINVSEAEYVEAEMQRMYRDMEQASGRRRNENQSYPRRGPNNRVKEVDLRVWETIYTDSLKVLNKWDQYYDIARALAFNVDIPNVDMMIEYAWNQKDWNILQQYEPILKNSESLKHRIYACYYAIKNQNIPAYDEIFKSIVQSAFYKWDLFLPKYIDNTVHFENLTLYQILMESSEGGRNFIKDLKEERKRGRVPQFQMLVNIWRERVPHMCEKLQLWREILENRNFLYDQFASQMIPNPIMPEPVQQFTSEAEQNSYKSQFGGMVTQQRQDFANEYLDKAWNYYKLAQVSRRHEMPLLSYSYLQMLDRQLNQSLFSGTEPTESLKYERFRFDFEKIKLQMSFNHNPDSLKRFMNEMIQKVETVYVAPYQHNLRLSQNEVAQVEGQQQMPRIVQAFEPFQIANLQRLIGDYFFKLGTLDKAQKYYKDSLVLNQKEYKAWLNYGKLNQTIYNIKKDDVSLTHVIKSYLTAISLALHKSRFIIPNLLAVLKKKNDVVPQQDLIQPLNLLKVLINQLPTWIWLFWLPQLLQMFYNVSNNIEIIFSRNVLEKISKLYPQVLYQPLKAKSDIMKGPPQQNLSQEEQRVINSQNQVVNQLMINIKRAANQQTMYLDRISTEFLKTTKAQPEEELQSVLSKILCMSSFFKIDNFDRDFNSFLTQLHARFLSPANTQASPLLAELVSIYERDFINPATREQNIIEVIKRVKNLKDFLYQRINLTEHQRSYLEQISPLLANFNEKGIELPGQYMLSEQEPVPQSVIYIQKFDPQIHRGSSNQSRRILIKCSNQRQYAFTASNAIQSKDELAKLFSEERLNQVKLVMNQIFKKHKETARRSVKFYVPIKAMMNRCKLVQDDIQFQSLQEIHDFLFQERGMDTDQALNIQIKKVEQTLAAMNSENYGNLQERTISSMSAEVKQRINEETFREMQNIYCKPYLLSTFFHRIFYNVDDLFMFKKYFTVHHAVNSFFAYVFSQAEYQTLHQMSTSKTTGCLTFNEAKLIEFLKNRSLRRVVNNLGQNPKSHFDVEALEKEDMSSPTYIPFRLSNNFVELMGGARGTGIQGMFAGVMTACSLAMGKYHEKLIPLLSLIFRDEMNDERELSLFYVSKTMDYIKYKMVSLSQNRQVLNLDHYLSDPEYVQHYQTLYNLRQQHQAQQQWENGANGGDTLDAGQANGNGCSNVQVPEKFVMFGHLRVPVEALRFEVEKPNVLEEFNKKVFDLIEMAMDEKRLSQMPTSWNAWF